MKNSWVSTSFPHSTSHSLLSVKFCQVKEEKRTLESNQIPEEKYTGPLSAVGNVSGYRCKSDDRSRGCEFDPCSVHTFLEIDHEINSTVFLLHSFSIYRLALVFEHYRQVYSVHSGLQDESL